MLDWLRGSKRLSGPQCLASSPSVVAPGWILPPHQSPLQIPSASSPATVNQCNTNIQSQHKLLQNCRAGRIDYLLYSENIYVGNGFGNGYGNNSSRIYVGNYV
eukprot:1633580-Amphidinium_carterae.1